MSLTYTFTMIATLVRPLCPDLIAKDLLRAAEMIRIEGPSRFVTLGTNLETVTVT